VGSIFKRGDVFYVSFKDAAGRRVKRAAGRNLAEAQRQLEDVETRPPLPAGLPQGVYPFTLAAKDYLRRLSIYGRPASIKNSGIAVKHLLGSFGSRDVNRLRSADLDTYILTRRDAGVKDRTINTELIVFRAVLNHAVHTENIPKLPVRVRLLKITKTLPKALSPEQVERLLNAADHRTKPVILTALYTGFRFQELISLNWSDVDFERRTISVTSKPEIGFAPKTHVERTNPMSHRLWSALQEHRSNLKHTRPQHPVFQMKAGVRWTPRLIRVIRDVFETAGLYRKEDKSGLHQCRRTFATNLLDKGVSIETTRQLGGWASVVMVQTYATTADRAKREAVEQLPF